MIAPLLRLFLLDQRARMQSFPPPVTYQSPSPYPKDFPLRVCATKRPRVFSLAEKTPGPILYPIAMCGQQRRLFKSIGIHRRRCRSEFKRRLVGLLFRCGAGIARRQQEWSAPIEVVLN